MSVILQTYEPKWFDACIGIFRSNSEPYFADYELDEFRAFLQSGDREGVFFVLVDPEDGCVVACGGFEPRGGAVTLTWGMVRRDRHGQGYGQRLVADRLARIRQRYGPIDVEIETSQHTQGFYAKQGFRVVKVTPDGFGPGLDNVFMTLDAR